MKVANTGSLGVGEYKTKFTIIFILILVAVLVLVSGHETTEISRTEARQIALEFIDGDGRVSSIELERYHGRLVWDVEILRGRSVINRYHDVYICADTGYILKHEINRWRF